MPASTPLADRDVLERLERHEQRLAELDRRLARLEIFRAVERGVPSFRRSQTETSTRLLEETPKAVRLQEIPVPIRSGIAPSDHPSHSAATPPVMQPVGLTLTGPTDPPERRERKPAPAFLGEAEFFEKLEKTEPVAPREPKEPWEVRLATVWLPRVAGVLILIGAAIGATLLPQELGKVARVLLGYGLTVALVVGGWFVRRRHEVLGRLTMAIGLAVGYFVSFAAHYVPPMRVIPAGLSILLMLAHVGTLAALAERWRSQSIAIAGLSLGVLAALVSAQTSQSFCLVALGILSLGAGVLLIRHEWRALTAVALAGTYLATLILWLFFPIGEVRNEVLAHLGALICYHSIFTVAFWRWGRIWVARERAMEEVPQHDGTPRMEPGLLPYSTSFAIMNSIGLAGLALFLFWQTKVLWPDIEWLLFGLAAIEVGRLLAPGLRRGTLLSFHILSAAAFLSAGLVAATSGLTEASVLAAEALILAVAASRARVLRFLRPLTAICAAMVLPAVDNFSAATLAQLVGELLPGILLLASTLRWEAVWVRRPKPFAVGWIAWLEFLASQFRAVAGAVLIAGALLSFFTGDQEGMAALALLTVAMLLGIAMLRATSWIVAAALASLGVLTFYLFNPQPAGWFVAVVLVVVILWNQARRTDLPALGRLGLDALLLPLALLAAAGAAWQMPIEWVAFRGTLVTVFALAVLGLEFLTNRLPEIPKLIRSFEEEEGEPPRWGSLGQWSGGAFGNILRFGYVLGLLMLLFGLGITATEDASRGLLSPTLLAVVFAGLWVAGQLRPRVLRAMRHTAPIPMLFLLLMAPPRFWNGEEPAFALSALLIVGVLSVGIARRCLWTALPAAMALAGLSAMALFVLSIGHSSGAAAVFGLGTALLIAMSSILVSRTPRIESVHETAFKIALALRVWFSVAAAVIALATLSTGLVVPAEMITVGWAAVGIAFLVGGFVFLDRPMRYTALAVFGVAVVRIFMRDLVDAETLTKAIAFLGVGILAICASIAYGILRKRLSPTGLDSETK